MYIRKYKGKPNIKYTTNPRNKYCDKLRPSIDRMYKHVHDKNSCSGTVA